MPLYTPIHSTHLPHIHIAAPTPPIRWIIKHLLCYCHPHPHHPSMCPTHYYVITQLGFPMASNSPHRVCSKVNRLLLPQLLLITEIATSRRHCCQTFKHCLLIRATKGSDCFSPMHNCGPSSSLATARILYLCSSASAPFIWSFTLTSQHSHCDALFCYEAIFFLFGCATIPS